MSKIKHHIKNNLEQKEETTLGRLGMRQNRSRTLENEWKRKLFI